MIRLATEADVAHLVELARAMHAEATALAHTTFDDEKVGVAFQRSIGDGPAFVHLDPAGEIDGMLLALVGERWYSRERMVSDLVVYMRPARRGGLGGYRLLDALLAWCEDRGIAPQNVQLGITTGVQPAATGAFYERLGFESAGAIYRLRSY